MGLLTTSYRITFVLAFLLLTVFRPAFGAAIKTLDEGANGRFCKQYDIVGAALALTNTGLNCTITSTAGAGDITAVGDCTSGSCFEGTSGTILTFNGSTGGTLEAAGGIFTFRGIGNTNNQDISFDFETVDTELGIYTDLSDTDNVRFYLDKVTVEKLAIEESGIQPISFFTIFQGGNQSGDITYTLPVNDGDANQFMQTNGSGVLSWAASSGDITDVGDCATGAAFSGSCGTVLTFTNSETIDNTNDDFIEFQGVGGADNTDIRIDLDGTHPVFSSPTDGIIGFEGGYVKIGDAGTVNQADGDGDLYVEDELEVDGTSTFFSSTHTGQVNMFGGSKMNNDGGAIFGTQDASEITFDTNQTNSGLFLGLRIGGDSNSSGNFIISELFDYNSADFAHGIQTDPHVFIQSADATSPSDNIELYHDQTDGHIDVGSGDLKITAAGGDIDFDNENLDTSGVITVGNDEASITFRGGYTSDPCSTIGEGSLFYNTTADELCFCDGSEIDLRVKDASTACF